jgi:hypothetical protein
VVGAVAVDVSASAPAQAQFSCGASPRGFGVTRGFSLVNYLIRPRQQRRRDRQAEDLRELFVLPFALRLPGDLVVGGGGVEAFRTSSTTSCHQCSAGALSSPSSRWRVSVNCGSWCHASQFARVLHVPTITLLSGLSDGRRSCPPTQPDAFLAADSRVRMAASQSRPVPSLSCTCVTIVIIGGSPYTSRDARSLTALLRAARPPRGRPLQVEGIIEALL